MRSKLRLRVLLPVAVLAPLTLGMGAFAFGGGDEEEPLPVVHRPAKPAAQPAAPTRAAWAKGANELCRTASAALAELGKAETTEEYAAKLPQTMEVERKLVADLLALPIPKADRPAIGSLLRLRMRSVALSKKAAAALGAQELGEFARVADRIVAVGRKGDAVARRLGAKACAATPTLSQGETSLAGALADHRVVVVVLHSPDASVDRLAIREARAGATEVKAGFLAVDVTDEEAIAAVAKRYGVRDAPAVLVVARWRGAVTVFDGYADRETIAQAAENAAL